MPRVYRFLGPFQYCKNVRGIVSQGYKLSWAGWAKVNEEHEEHLRSTSRFRRRLGKAGIKTRGWEPVTAPYPFTTTMTKRDFIQTELPRSISTPARPQKRIRRRTGEFIDRLNQYESSMKVLRFFNDELTENVRTNNDSQGDASGKPQLPNSSVMRQHIQQQMDECTIRHESYCAKTREVANEMVMLTRSFRCASKAISHDRASTIGALNMGSETTQSLLQHIAEFAGVPSEEEFTEWAKLQSLLVDQAER